MALRWEWRTFGADFGDLESRLRAAASSTRASEERYVLGRDSHANVKVRGNALDVKTLEEVNADGLQLWRPTLTAAFPIDSRTVYVVADLLAASAPVLRRDRYTVDEWLGDVVVVDPRLTSVRVAKARHGSTRNGCLVEIAYLVVAELPVTTIAVESEDPALVAGTLRALALTDRPNEDYVTALKRLAAHTPVASGAAPWRALV